MSGPLPFERSVDSIKSQLCSCVLAYRKRCPEATSCDASGVYRLSVGTCYEHSCFFLSSLRSHGGPLPTSVKEWCYCEVLNQCSYAISRACSKTKAKLAYGEFMRSRFMIKTSHLWRKFFEVNLLRTSIFTSVSFLYFVSSVSRCCCCTLGIHSPC